MPPSPADRLLILAAGRGTRMGGPKALMTLDGVPWWRHQSLRIAASGAIAPVPLWVVSPVVADALCTASPDSRIDCVLADPHAPMFASILAGLKALATAPPAGVFILPVDVPAPARAEVWQAIRREASAPDSAKPVLIPRFHDARGHPIYLPWPWLARHILQPTRAAERLDELIAPCAREVEVHDPAVCININTPADLEAYRRSSLCVLKV